MPLCMRSPRVLVQAMLCKWFERVHKVTVRLYLLYSWGPHAGTDARFEVVLSHEYIVDTHSTSFWSWLI